MKIEFSFQRREMLLFLDVTCKPAIDSLVDWWMDWSIDWLIDWLTDWPTDWLIDRLTDWLVDWLIDWLIGRITCFSSWSTLEAVILCSIYNQSANLTNHDPGTRMNSFRWNDDGDKPLWSGLLVQNIGRIVTDVTKVSNLAQSFLSTYWLILEGVPVTNGPNYR